MAEWLKAAVLKTVRDESPSRVRISLPPQNKNSGSSLDFLFSAQEIRKGCRQFRPTEEIVIQPELKL